MKLIATVPLIMLAAVGPTVTMIDETRFRVENVYRDRTPTGHANAQIALMRAASKHCRGKGVAVSEGSLELNNAEPTKGGKKALALSEVYSCKPAK